MNYLFNKETGVLIPFNKDVFLNAAMNFFSSEIYRNDFYSYDEKDLDIINMVKNPIAWYYVEDEEEIHGVSSALEKKIYSKLAEDGEAVKVIKVKALEAPSNKGKKHEQMWISQREDESVRVVMTLEQCKALDYLNKFCDGLFYYDDLPELYKDFTVD